MATIGFLLAPRKAWGLEVRSLSEKCNPRKIYRRIEILDKHGKKSKTERGIDE